MENKSLDRYITAQERDFPTALTEISYGRKNTLDVVHTRAAMPCTKWLKNTTRKRQEFVIGGWAQSNKSRSLAPMKTENCGG